MSRFLKTFLSLLAVLAFVLSLVCCGSSNETISGEEGGASSSGNGDAESKYREAMDTLNEGKTEEAYDMLRGISDYPKAAETLKNFFFLPGTVFEKWIYGEEEKSPAHMDEYTYNSDGNVVSIKTEHSSYSFEYNSDGLVVRGPDLLYIGNGTNTYEYDDEGRLKTVTGGGAVETYYYNDDGTVARSEYVSEDYRRETEYIYTYYQDGSVKTKRIFASGDDDNYIEFLYDESGRLVTFTHTSWGIRITWNLSYGEYGLSSIVGAQCNFKYTYNEKGAVAEINAYSNEGPRSREYTITFADFELFYIENPAIKERISIVNLTDVFAASEIIY